MDSTGGKGTTDLAWAARNGRIEVARALIEGGTDVNAQTEDGRTTLMIAAEDGQLQMAKYLVEHGASLTARDSVGNTVLMAAAEKGRVEICQYLTELPGCDVNAANAFGHTAPLHTDISMLFGTSSSNSALTLILRANPVLQR